MLIEILLLILAAGITAAIGIPIVTRISLPHLWARHAPLDAQATRAAARTGPAFEPLDLGPMVMRWPSEVERPDQGPKEPPWPSQTWDDEHFGAIWRTPGAAKPVATQRTPPPQPRTKRTPAPSTQRNPPRQPQRAARSETDLLMQAADQLIRGTARAPQELFGQAQEVAATAQQAAGVPPGPEELRRMVGTVGLAGTVQHIMERTGWDFRQAAHYLARIRQQG